jgi:hypothetical protein
MIARRSLLCALAGLLPSAAFASEPLPAQIVADADAFRLPQLSATSGVRADLRVIDGEGAARRIDKITVLTRDTSSLVQVIDGDQRGMKFLSSPAGYWLYAPRTRRAIRLTPLQLLRGQASIGDISRLRFAQDYEASFAAERSVIVEGRDCWVLDLRATAATATYSSIRLRIAKSNRAPIDADMMLASGRKLKTVQFGPPSSVRGHPAIVTTTYIDAINAAKRTSVELLDVQPSKVSPGMFKPEALATEF